MANPWNHPPATGWAGASAMSFNPTAAPIPTLTTVPLTTAPVPPSGAIPPMPSIVTPWTGPPARSWTNPQFANTPVSLYDANGNLFPRLFTSPTPQSAVDMEYTPFDVETAFLLGQSRTKPARQLWLQHHRQYLAPHYFQLPAEGTLRIKMSQRATLAEQNFRATPFD